MAKLGRLLFEPVAADLGILGIIVKLYMTKVKSSMSGDGFVMSLIAEIGYLEKKVYTSIREMVLT